MTLIVAGPALAGLAAVAASRRQQDGCAADSPDLAADCPDRFMQGRWLYYAVTGRALPDRALLPDRSDASGRDWRCWLIFLAGLADADYEQIEGHATAPPNQPSLQLAQISRAIDEPGGIMAPWWLSPGLLYFSGQPIVSGSSHCGISGIVASAKFFSTTSWAEAEHILRERQVRWVVVWDDPALRVSRCSILRAAFSACPTSPTTRKTTPTPPWRKS